MSPESLDNRRPATEEVWTFWRAGCGQLGIDADSTPFQVWYFGDGEPMATDLALLVRSGRKRATAALEAAVLACPETGPVLGGYSVVTDFAGAPLALIRTERIDVYPFESVPAEFAYEEGEGDRTLAHWREGHWRFFASECAALGIPRSPQMRIIGERFVCLYPAPPVSSP